MRGVISMSGACHLGDLNPLPFGSIRARTFRDGRTVTAGLAGSPPATYVRSGELLPPFFVLHCQFDLLSLPEQAILCRVRLEATGSDVSWTFVSGYTHECKMTALADRKQATTRVIVDSIATHVRKTTSLPLITGGRCVPVIAVRVLAGYKVSVSLAAWARMGTT